MDNNQDNKNIQQPETACKSCELDMGRGYRFCSCEGEESTAANVCEGCFKLHVTDWLKDYPDNLQNDIFEVRFKNTRRGYYHNVNNLPLVVGDTVAVEASPGHDIGIISLTGDMVGRQMRRVGFKPMNGEFKKIYRKAKPYDIEKWKEAIALEHDTMIRARQIAAEMNLNMKIGDVEYQGDKIKAIFYYIADERVDFRELIKVFADVFRIRVEMKQIGARQEAGRIGGLGACGRELCCASWMSSFMSVTTNSARAQDISLNPQKLAGQCSKLKCCLVYEYDTYMDARKDFPTVHEPLRALDGDYYFVKNDILSHTMMFSTSPDAMVGVVELPISRVREILKLNSKGVKPEKLTSEKEDVPKEVEPHFVNAIGEDSITRFDSTKKGNKRRKDKRGNGNGGNGVRDNQKEPNEKVASEQSEVTAGDKPSNNRKPQRNFDRNQGAKQNNRQEGKRDNSGGADRANPKAADSSGEGSENSKFKNTSQKNRGNKRRQGYRPNRSGESGGEKPSSDNKPPKQ